jgi:threonine/homoserine/homoserine lactone efflux protein
MTTALLAAFVAICVVAYGIPGPDWVVVLQRSAHGVRAGLVAGLGVQAGLVVHMTAAAAGVSAVLLSSAVAFTVLKTIGAAYLVYLGMRALWQARRTPRAVPSPRAGSAPAPLRRVFLQAFLANVLNPKAALFFVGILPQFLQRDLPVAPQVLLLGAIDIAIGLVWWTIFVLLTSRLAGLMERPRPRRILDRVTGTVLVGLGVTLATTH